MKKFRDNVKLTKVSTIYETQVIILDENSNSINALFLLNFGRFNRSTLGRDINEGHSLSKICTYVNKKYTVLVFNNSGFTPR